MAFSDMTPEILLNTLPDVSHLPVEQWHPGKIGEIAIYIDSDGQWFYRGVPFTRKKLVILFSRLLRKEGGSFYLVTPVEKVQIRVEDAPFTVVQADFSGKGKQQRVRFISNVGDSVILSKRCPLHMQAVNSYGDKACKNRYIPYVRIRCALEAKVNRNVFYQMAEYAEQRNGEYGIWSEGDFWQL